MIAAEGCDFIKQDKRKRVLKTMVAFCVWIIVWFLLELLLPESVAFAGPCDVAIRLFKDILSKPFWIAIFTTYSGIVAGFVAAVIIGTILGYLAYYFEGVDTFVTPVMDFFRYIPMITFTVLAIVWGSQTLLTVEVSIFLALPTVYRHTLLGLRHDIGYGLHSIWKHKISIFRKIDLIYRPATMPEYMVGCHRALNMCCKSGILAQFLGHAKHSVGSSLSTAMENLDVAGIFSWTIVIVILSVLLERIVIHILSLKIVNEREIDVEKIFEALNEDEEVDL